MEKPLALSGRYFNAGKHFARMKNRLKRWLFTLLGKNPEAVIVCLRSPDQALSDAMVAEIRSLEPGRKILEASSAESYAQLRSRFRNVRIGLMPVMMPIPAAAWLLAPTKILAYNARLERHHLRLSIASWLFLRGVALDRIFLRPFSRETVRPTGHRVLDGRPRNPKRKTVAVLTPYFPYPLSHGGAVRMFNLLRETAKEFDVVLYAFTEAPVTDAAPILEFCSRVFLVEKPRYREPRWSTVAPPEVGEYHSPEMLSLWKARPAGVAQVEYTYLASYGGDVLVEHDVTFDLYQQIRARRNTFSAWWDWWRWRRFETSAVKTFRQIVVMSEKDADLLGTGRIIENGVDLARFVPQSEKPGRKVLFIGSFRHFPNIEAFRYLTDQILPLAPPVDLTVVAGPDAWLHWTHYTGTLKPAYDFPILEFVADVRPLYNEANLVVVPTLESAGTNVKVLEAMAMQRAVISTVSGCAGIGAQHAAHILIAPSPQRFAESIGKLLDDPDVRAKIASGGRSLVERCYDWRAIGLKQRALLRELTGKPIEIRKATAADLPAIAAIQSASPEASQWTPESYLNHDCQVAMVDGRVAGFLATRKTAPGEGEILNLAVDPLIRRSGIARILMETLLASDRGDWFLEVRESNAAAVNLYKTLGFCTAGRRENYYHDPPEAAIVMRVLS
jgi:ribosomal protein S18 acetylase RimI-like enzyme/glycosyltransferase involved in cell wall biosynthesis